VTLFGAVQTYINGKQVRGVLFEAAAKILRSFSKEVGDVSLGTITPAQILDFLNSPQTSYGTWSKKFSLLRFFFEYWSARGLLERSPMPPHIRPPLVLAQAFVPYVYTRNEVRLLLRGTSAWQKSSRQNMKTGRMDSRTFRTFLLTLYATGMRTGEALTLLREDVDVKRSAITIRGARFGRVRKIPIGSDLCARLRRHKHGLSRVPIGSPYFFVGKDGKALKEPALIVAFRKLRRLAGIERYDGAIYQPRMHDLRATFAVHRLTRWLRQGGDLNRLIPALSAYMGQCGLGSSERYLRLTPERFRNHLVKLSPQHPNRKRWRDDRGLMKFLDQL
jgi:integrase/recombinase XerD